MRKILATGVLGVAMLAASVSAAHAERGRVPPVTDPAVIKECGACHMVFQPGFLPAASWTKLMADLKNHFGDNATLDPAIAKPIEDYLTANAEDAKRGKAAPAASGAAPLLRISETSWFKSEHGRKGRSSPETLKKHNAKSMADCKACHQGAEKGNYDDD